MLKNIGVLRMATEGQMVAKLRKRYPSPAWALLQHVRNQTGFKKATVRTADAMALSLYPSNGICLHGFEIKVSASDLRKELTDPTKAAEFSEYCDYWWIVLGDESLMKGVEIPETWGILASKGTGLGVVRQAPKLSAKPMDIGLVCGLIRKANEAHERVIAGMVPREEIQKAVDERIAVEIDTKTRQINRQLVDLSRSVKEFEEASGVSIAHRWDIGRIGEAVKHVIAHGKEGISDRVKREIDLTSQYVQTLRGYLEAVESGVGV